MAKPADSHFENRFQEFSRPGYLPAVAEVGFARLSEAAIAERL